MRASRYASSSAVATSSSSTSGSTSWLTGGSSGSLPSMDIPLVGVSLPPPLADHVAPEKLKTTTLSNGLKIASEMTSVSASFSNPNINFSVTLLKLQCDFEYYYVF